MLACVVPAFWKSASKLVPERFVKVLVGLTSKTVVAPDEVPSTVGAMFTPTKVLEPAVGLKVGETFKPCKPPLLVVGVNVGSILHPMNVKEPDAGATVYAKAVVTPLAPELLPISTPMTVPLVPVKDEEFPKEAKLPAVCVV